MQKFTKPLKSVWAAAAVSFVTEDAPGFNFSAQWPITAAE